MANGDGENGGRFMTWKAIASILISLLIIVGSYALGTALADAKSNIKELQDKKVDKEAYYRDISRLEQTMCEMDRKLDRLLSRDRR
jgi:hypothetical protein